MELTTNFKSQMIQNQVTAVGINPNYFYPVPWGNGLKAIEMLKSKQGTHLKNTHRCYVEITSATIARQTAIVNQYEKFMQQSKQLSDSTNGNYQKSSPSKQALA